MCCNVYHLIAHFTVHRRHPLDEKKTCSLCLCDPDSVTPTKLYTIKELVMMETYIAGFHKNFYITEIQNLPFHLP